MSIAVKGISKTFGAYRALDHVDLEVRTGELIALLGPSGSGKTTLLRIIAGLEQADPGSGEVRFQDEDVAHRHVSARGVGFVFQHYALFRHMTIFENIAFGLRVKKRGERPSKAAITEKVQRLLQLVQLDGLSGRYPHQLSGGQRQRVALARALAVEPKVLLLDEPFGALDAKVRKELRAWLRRLHDEIHVTSVFVTHDQDEALEVADRVVVMNAGRIEQDGTPDEVFHRPATEFVVNFLGNVNLFHGRIEGGRVRAGKLAFPQDGASLPEGQEARAFIRPYDVLVRREATPGAVPATVVRVQSAGPVVKVEVESEPGSAILAELPHAEFRALGITAGEQVFVSVREARVFAEERAP